MKLTDTLNFADVYSQVKDQKMPLRLAYKFSKLATRMDEEVQFYRTKFQEIVDQFIEKDEEGKPVVIDNGAALKIIAGKEQECNQAMIELQGLEIDLEQPFTIEELENLELTPAQMQVLMPFVKDEA